MTSPRPQREESARLWPEYNTPKRPTFFSAKLSSFEFAWWWAAGITARDIAIYHGWAIPHPAFIAIPSMFVAMGVIYLLRWVFRQ